MSHRFRVIRLWEQPVEDFISIPGLLPYAVLAQTTERERVLEQVVVALERVASVQERNNLIAAAGIFAGLELSQATISRIIRSDVMRESVIYQEILRAGRIEGRVEGRVEGEKELVFKLLTRKLGNLDPEIIASVDRLAIAQIESLGEALLDFTTIADLESWLDRHL